jgi:glyceraldehyde 3-phosphate dehydrogenase
MTKALNDYKPIQTGFMTTIHAYTGDQMILDGPQRKGDLRRARAGAVNIVPNSTGAAKAIGLVIPELAGKLTGNAMRVPVPSGSITILDAIVKDESDTITAEEVNAVMKAAVTDSYGYCDEEIVSSDIIGMSYGSLFDATQTLVMKCADHLFEVRVTSWYDNEMSYVSQLVRTLKHMVSLG